MKQKSAFLAFSPSPMVGSVFMIMGCCIGAGMLALPLVSIKMGFFFSLLPMLASQLYMYLSGLAILEVYANAKGKKNLMGMLEDSLGAWAKYIGFALFCFLFYSLLTAYLNASSLIIEGWLNLYFQNPPPIESIIFINSLFLFLIVFFGTRGVDLFNRICMGFLIACYLGLVLLGLCQSSMSNLLRVDFTKEVFLALAIFIVSFGFQNLIPTLAHYLKNDYDKVKAALFRGSIATLLVYLCWNLVALGTVPTGATGLNSNAFITEVFSKATPRIHLLVNGFSLFAILTSLLTVALSFTNFISDRPDMQKGRSKYVFFVVIPPLLFSLLNTNIFISALRVAGGDWSCLAIWCFTDANGMDQALFEERRAKDCASIKKKLHCHLSLRFCLYRGY